MSVYGQCVGTRFTIIIFVHDCVPECFMAFQCHGRNPRGHQYSHHRPTSGRKDYFVILGKRLFIDCVRFWEK